MWKRSRLEKKLNYYYQVLVETWLQLLEDTPLFLDAELAFRDDEASHAREVEAVINSIEERTALPQELPLLAKLSGLDQGIHCMQSSFSDSPPQVEVETSRYMVIARPSKRKESHHSNQVGHISNWLVYHHIIPSKINKISINYQRGDSKLRKLKTKKEFRVYVGTFEDLVKPKLEVTKAGFYIEELENEDLRWEKVQQALQAAKTAEVDCLLFPELTLPPKLREQIINWLYNNCPPFTFVLPGSFHEFPEKGDFCGPHKSSKHRVNKAILMDGRGKPIFSQCKIIPFGTFDQAEDIQSGNQITMLNTPVGLMMVLICRDFCEEGPLLNSLFDALQPNWIFVPAMTPKPAMSAYVKQAKKLNRAYKTTTIFAHQIFDAQFPDKPYIHGFVFYQDKAGIHSISPQNRIINIPIDH